LANPKIPGFLTNIGFGQLVNMDPRAFNKIFPEEITSVDEFIKNKNKNIRGEEADTVDGETHQREETQTHHREGEANHKEEKPLVEVKSNKSKTEGVKMKKALIEEKEVEIYSKQLDSLA